VITRGQRATLVPIAAMVAVFGAMFTAAVNVEAQAQPTNSLANPYRTMENWAKLPQGRGSFTGRRSAQRT
jgi:hypothetical protein